VYGYPKSERENITETDLQGFRKLAKDVFSYDVDDLPSLFREVICQ